MADLGPVGYAPTLTLQRRKVVSDAVYKRRAAGDPKVLDIDVTGIISGVVAVSGVPRAGVVVGLFYRSSMRLIERAITDAVGAYSFDGLDKNDLEAYCAMAQDPNESSPYLYTQAHDHITAG